MAKLESEELTKGEKSSSSKSKRLSDGLSIKKKKSDKSSSSNKDSKYGTNLLVSSSTNLDLELDNIFKTSTLPRLETPPAKIFSDKYAEEQANTRENQESLDTGENSKTKREEKPLVLSDKNDPLIQARTVFVGNVPLVCLEKKENKALKNLFSAYGKISAVRFRSVALKKSLSRKVGIIQKNLHPERTSLNSYIVFEKEESAKQAALEQNGKLFLGKHLRVDTCTPSATTHNKKKSIFIGNLAFNAEEEELWSFFQGCGEIKNVRVIRDSVSHMGKGFGYVEFKNSSSVSSALALDNSEFKTRKLRVSKYKANEKASQSSSTTKSKPSTSFKKDQRTFKKSHPSKPTTTVL